MCYKMRQTFGLGFGSLCCPPPLGLPHFLCPGPMDPPSCIKARNISQSCPQTALLMAPLKLTNPDLKTKLGLESRSPACWVPRIVVPRVGRRGWDGPVVWTAASVGVPSAELVAEGVGPVCRPQAQAFSSLTIYESPHIL